MLWKEWSWELHRSIAGRYQESMKTPRRTQIQEIYEVLPGLDCGLCGYGNCRGFAEAVVHGKAPISACRQDPFAARKIAAILGGTTHTGPVHTGASVTGMSTAGPPIAAASIRLEVDGLAKQSDALLARIEALQR